MYFLRIISKAKYLISNDKLEEAIEFLKTHFRDDPIFDDLVVVSADLHRIQKQVIKGTIEDNYESIQKNRIIDRLLSICKVLEKDYKYNQDRKNERKFVFVKSKRVERELQEQYSKLFDWIQKFFREENKRLKNIFKQGYQDKQDYVESLPLPPIAKFNSMMQLPYDILKGDLGVLLQVQREKDSAVTDEIIMICHSSFDILEKSSIRYFTPSPTDNSWEQILSKHYDFILDKAQSEVQILKEIYESGYEENNLGGVNSLIKSVMHLDKQLILSADQIGFKIVKDPSALPNLIMDRKIELRYAFLRTVRKKNAVNHSQEDDDNGSEEGVDSKFTVLLSLGNLTEKEIECLLPKGLIFEGKSLPTSYSTKMSQNLAVRKSTNVKIPPKEQVEFEIDACCINEGFNPPNNEPGNVTIFEFEDKDFQSNDDLWKIIKEREDDIRDNLSF